MHEALCWAPGGEAHSHPPTVLPVSSLPPSMGGGVVRSRGVRVGGFPEDPPLVRMEISQSKASPCLSVKLELQDLRPEAFAGI